MLELTGTPKAGKSTSVAVLHNFFKQAGYQVHLLTERAADCPLPMKGHFFFNAWTAATMLAEVLETHETNVDLLILDRGFFDALIWLELQTLREQVNDEEKRVFSEFVLLARWRSLVDATVIMRVDPEKALERENKDQIVRRKGSMMNLQALAQFNSAMEIAVKNFGNQFSLSEIDTTAADGVVNTNVDLLGKLLPKMRKWADPRIAVVPKQLVESAFAQSQFLPKDDGMSMLKGLVAVVKYIERSAAEKDQNVVQLVAAGIHTHGERVVVLEREARDRKAGQYGRHTLWVGCHVDVEAADLQQGAVECLKRRIQQDLHLGTPPDVDFLGLAWDSSKEPSHLGIMFQAPISNDDVADHLENKQFKKMGRSPRITSVFMTTEEVLRSLESAENALELEPWSKHIVKNLKLPAMKDLPCGTPS